MTKVKKTMALTIDPNVWKRLKAITAMRELKMGDVVARMVTEYVRDDSETVKIK